MKRSFVLLAVLSATACGQKGAPLAPIVYLPRPVTQVTAKRIENEVVIQFTVPTVNTDGTEPADLREIEVYAHTGPLPAPADFIKYGTLVAEIPIKEPPKPEQTAEAETAGAAGSSAVAPPGAKADAAGAGAPDAAGATAPPTTNDQRPTPNDQPSTMVEQGWTTTVREVLTPKHMEPGPVPPTRPAPPPDPKAAVVVVEKIETPGTINFDLVPQRYYAIFPVSDSRGRRGPHAGPIQIALFDPPAPPDKIDIEYSENAISLTWPGQPEDIPMTAPVGLSAAALGQTPGAEGAPGLSAVPPPEAKVDTVPPAEKLPPVDRETEGTVNLYADVETEGTRDVFVAVTPAATPGAKPKPAPALVAQPPAKPRYGYNVYEAGAMSATGAIGATGAESGVTTASTSAPTAQTATVDKPTAPIAPINASLLTAPGFQDPRVEFGVERCYVVRRVEMAGPIPIESAPTPPTCVKPVDTFPPAAPKSLAHIAGANGVSLLWEANTEPDLGGYVVLRGEAPGDKLSPLTKEPIRDTSFLDTTARRGRTYVYEVIAVDQSTPPNRSAPSNRVEETIR